jgi:hypothetical protein
MKKIEHRYNKTPSDRKMKCNRGWEKQMQHQALPKVLGGQTIPNYTRTSKARDGKQKRSKLTRNGIYSLKKTGRSKMVVVKGYAVKEYRLRGTPPAK